jgi:hypothetical protein
MQFKKTTTNQRELCNFIEKNYKTASMLNSVTHTQHFLNHTKNNKKTNLNFVLSNLRMSICDLG